MDANNNQARTPHQEEEASIDILSKSSEENSQISSMAKSQEDVTKEIRISKRRSVYLFNSFSVQETFRDGVIFSEITCIVFDWLLFARENSKPGISQSETSLKNYVSIIWNVYCPIPRFCLTVEN